MLLTVTEPDEGDTSSKSSSKSSRHLSPGRDDDEPTTTKASSKQEVRERRSASSTSRPETVDRGVGPTPAPPPLSLESARGTFFPIPPYPEPRDLREARGDPRDPRDPRNGLLEGHPLGYPFSYPHLGYPVNPPLAVTSHTHEGRYQWPPVSSHFHHLGHGLSAGSPTYSDISLLSMQSRLAGAGGVAGVGDVLSPLATRLQWDHQYRRLLHAAPMHHRGYSPTTFSGVFLPPHPTAGTSLSQRSLFTDIPPTPGSGSITLPGSAESSRLTSPRPSIISKPGRKRALSHSPFSECGLDIESLTRSSQGSLQLTPFGADPHSRSSSAASGSYGHLSAGSLGPSPPHGLPLHHPLLRHGTGLPGASPFFPPLIHPLLRQHGPGLLPTIPHHVSLGPPKHEHTIPPSSRQDPSSSSVVSSTVDPQNDPKKSRFKKECSSDEMKCDDDGRYGDPSRVAIEGEPDFVETNCHWKDCHKEFDTQDELVRHINQDHIQANKKLFICLWEDCSREAKAFKAQYMLVVHMRRHTGEKPHNCTFEGCDKAYSRLENLKTHLRSHTGEKPYMCEFPGCTKAFSNASDRAKHQNRTHSNAKPYVCKAPGCSKRYTDPSSLRKHVKTVHGPEFYANKKHKGNDHHGGGSDRGEGDNQDGGKSVKMEDSDSCDKTDNPSSVESQQTHHNPSTESKMEQSPASTHSAYSDMDDTSAPHQHLPSGVGTGTGTGTGGDGDDEEEDDDDDIVIPASNSAAVATAGTMRMRGVAANRLKGRLTGKASISNLPPLPPVGPRPTHTTITDLGDNKHGPRHITHHRRLTDLISQNSSQDCSSLPSFTGRRDSNTSTLSSYLSSIRSDASPYPFNSSFSSRRSSEASQMSSNRLSIANSPYEYDITGNFPSATSRRHGHANVNSQAMQTVTSQMENARLGSQTSLNMPQRLPPVSNSTDGSARSSSEHAPLTGAVPPGGRREGWRSSTPCRTPLPHEIPNRDIRRASDPVRAADPGFAALHRLQRFHSLNQVKPLPIPDGMKSLRDQGKADSGHNWSSSHSSIATDYSFQDDLDGSQILGESLPLRSLDEDSLDLRMMEDSEDMLIPDDMQRFLNEQYQHTLGAPLPADSSTMPEFSRENSPGRSRAGALDSVGTSQGLPFSNHPTSQATVPKPCRHQLSMTASWTSSQVAPGDDNESLRSCSSRQSQAYTPSFHHQPTPPPGSGLAVRQGLSRRRLLHAQLQSPNAPSVPVLQGDVASQQMPPPAVPPPPQQQQQQQQHSQQHQQQLQYYGPHLPQQPQMAGGFAQQGLQMGGMQSPMMQQPQYPAQSPQPMYGPNMLMGQYGHLWGQQGMANPQMQQQQQVPPPYPMSPYYGPSYPPPQHADVVTKQERASPQVQVAQISQSQIPPRAKMANTSERGYQQQQQQHQHPMQQNPQQQQHLQQQQQSQHQPQVHQQVMASPQHAMQQQGYGVGMQQGMVAQRSYPAYPPYPMQHANMAVQQQMVQPYSMAHRMMGPPTAAAAAGSFAQQQQQQQQQLQQQQQQQLQQPQQRPSCQLAAGGSLLEMQMSPDCNRVSSTTDVKECQTDLDLQLEGAMAPGLRSLSTENLIDNLSSISVENMHVLSPTTLIRSVSQTSSRMTTPYNMEGKASGQSSLMDASNMVVNDMSSVLTQLAEENRYFNSNLR